MALFKDIIRKIEEDIPLQLQEEWDNSGIQIHCSDEVHRMLIAMEITDAVIDEAISCRADMILTHHPLIFSPASAVDMDTVQGRYITRLITGGINVYSSHTCFDKARGGNNDALASLIGLSEIRPMQYENGDPEPITRMGELAAPADMHEFTAMLKGVLGIDAVRVAGPDPEIVKKVGICTGAGAEFAELARANGCEVFITGDLKYHEAQSLKEQGICIIDAGHWGTEKIFSKAIYDIIAEKLCDAEGTAEPDLQIILSQKDLEPMRTV